MPELSYSRGPHLALRAETIFEARSRMARRLPAHEALVVRHQNARLTYRELKERVEETARGPRPRVRRAHRGMGQQLRRVGSPFPRRNCWPIRSEEHTSNSSHVSISYAVFCLKKKKNSSLDNS